jgi:outer membrane protein OmpA-like peptidoglycan-associated protein
VLALQRSAGNRATVALLQRTKVTKRKVGERGTGAATGYEPGEKEASRTSTGQVESTKDGTLLFDIAVNSNDFKAEHETQLRKMFKDLRWDSTRSLFPIKEIVGFTDAVHRQAGNEELREERADTVQAFLQIIGAHKSNVGVVRAAPADRFIDTNETRAGRAHNRAVLIVTDAFLPPPDPDPPPVPPPNSVKDCCTPFPTRAEAIAVRDRMLRHNPDVPLEATFVDLMVSASFCGEVRPVWEAYLLGTGTPFSFTDASRSCVAAHAKTGSDAGSDHVRAINSVFDLIMAFLPQTLMKAPSPPAGVPGNFAEVRVPIVEAVGPDGEPGLHVDITYKNAPRSAAGQLIGGTGRDGNGSDVFGDDDRVMGGEAIVTVTEVDSASGAMGGIVTWRPHVHVKDTVDFCPGNMGGGAAQMVTVPLSRLEASGVAKDVPITVDYVLDDRTRKFRGVVPGFVSPPVPPKRLKPPPGPDEHPCRIGG